MWFNRIFFVLQRELWHSVYLYIAVVPNRSSPPAVLLRESFRENGKVHNRTLANISHWPPAQVAALREVLKGATTTAKSATEAFEMVRSLPHGHVAAVVESIRHLKLDAILGRECGGARGLVVAMIAARILDPACKLATARALHPDTLTSSLSR
jgi:hypothetical protein